MKPTLGTELKVRDEDLLNPHGSDETIQSKSKATMSSVFLTHTVQMKPEITTPNII